ncbi:LysM domain [Lasallia pustulata]|uniref:LysM domain n=1 Tax=Lasallia pustulata TaxID=136370 RepID=A0A1W5DC34_9LECA|nr:LysM domain [Lasallia pustulata]
MAALILALAIWAAAIIPAYAQFSMWPAVNSTQLASAMGFSVDCLNAMNTTVTCDPDLFRMAGQVDLYYWVQDNITDLCTPSCLQSSSEWLEDVYNTCDGQTITIDSKMVPVESVAIRYSDGIGLTCLTDIRLPIMLSYNQTPEVDPSTTSSPVSVNGTSTAPASASSSTGNGTTIEFNNSTFNYCFLEAQNWVGVDITAPDCTSDSNNTLCIDPDAANRIANLYNDTILCSNCFLSVMWWRINSPFLPDTDESDFLIEQFQDITDVCNVTMPPSLIRALPSYPAAPSPTYLPPGTDPNANMTASNGATCGGQTIAASSSKRDDIKIAERDPKLLELEEDYSGYARVKRASAGSCDSLSQTYGVTTGDLQSITGTDDCSFNASSICVPLKCEVAQVGNNQSCASIANSLSTSSINVTIALFLQWNPDIIGLCDNLTMDQYICSGPPGGGYTLPAPINGTNTNAGGQQRGGQGSDSNPNGPDGPDGPTPNSTTSAPTQVGIAENCDAFAYAGTNDTCYDMSQSFLITLAQLTAWNPVLGYPDGHNCTTQFWTGYDYCVGVSGPSTNSSGTSIKSSATTSSLPYPTQSGITSACDKYVEAETGDYCYMFAQNNNITTDELYSWNAILGSNGANCSTEFQAGYDYCVGVSTMSSTITQTSIPPSLTTTSTAVPT